MLALTTASLTMPAYAQDAAPQDTATEENGGLQDIVVTARRVAENLQDVPVAITAFSGETLAQQNAVQVADIGRTTPSLTFKDSPSNPAAPAITLRGQVQTDILATLDPSVGTYVDGYYWARAYGLNSQLLDVRSVQVLKGPQGTLFGRNTTGGAMLIETNDPNFNGISGMVQGSYGRFNERGATAVLNLPIIDDAVALRGAFTILKRDGTTKDTLLDRDYDERNSWTGRVKLLIRPTYNLDIVLSAERYDLKVNNPGRRLGYVQPGTGAVAQAGGLGAIGDYIDSITGSPNSTALNVDPLNDIETQTYTGTVNLDTFFGAIKFIGGYRKIEGDTILDLDGSPFAIHTTNGQQSLEQYSGEVQITGKAFDEAVDFATGVTYFHEEGVDKSSSITLPALNPRTTLFRGDIDNDSMGAYAQATWHITDRLGFTGGLRYSVEDKGLAIFNTAVNRTTGAVTCQVAGLVAPNCGLSRKDDFSGWSYTAGFDYKITDDVLVYIKTSKGFRSGGQNLRASGTAAFVPFQPEIAYAHEAGLKSEFFDRRVRFNFAGYYSTVNDIQRTTLQNVAPGVTATVVGNAGKARIWGLEADLTAQVFDGFTLGATGTITRPKYEKYSDLAGDRRAERFDGVAKEQFSLSATYEHDFDFADFTIRSDYSWQSKTPLQGINYYTDPNGVIRETTGNTVINPVVGQAIVDSTTAPAAGILSLRAALAFNDNQFEVAVYGRNLTNERGLVSALYVPGLTYTSGQLRDPATYGVQATFRFGN